MTDLPPGWEWASLGELVEINPRKFSNTPSDDERLSFIPMASVEAESGRIDVSKSETFGKLKNKSLTKFQDNDVLFAKITPCMENGKITVARGMVGGRGLGSTEFHVLRSLGKVEPRYLQHYLLQKKIRLFAEQSMTGAVGQRRVPRGFLQSLLIPLPSYDEQQLIVDKLEKRLSQIRMGLFRVDNAGRLAVHLNKSIIEYGLDSIAHKKVSLRDILQQPLSNGRSVTTKEGGFPVLRLTAIRQGKVTLSERKDGDWTATDAHPFLVKRGDIFVVRGNGSLSLVGQCGLVADEPSPIAFPDTMIRVRINNTIISPEYLCAIWSSNRIRKQVESSARTTAGIYKINQHMIENIEIPLPELEDQERLVLHAKNLASSVRSVNEISNTINIQGRALQNSLLAAAFSGRLSVQKHLDQPTSKLLVDTKARRENAAIARNGRGAHKSAQETFL